MTAEARVEIHHCAPRCLLGLFDAAPGGLADWAEFDAEAVRWGRPGGRRTLALYGRPYFSLLARFRWGRVELEALIAHRAGRSKGADRWDPPPRV
jgi:hypothetical protein